jgi:hypothetical protein
MLNEGVQQIAKKVGDQLKFPNSSESSGAKCVTIPMLATVAGSGVGREGGSEEGLGCSFTSVLTKPGLDVFYFLEEFMIPFIRHLMYPESRPVRKPRPPSQPVLPLQAVAHVGKASKRDLADNDR